MKLPKAQKTSVLARWLTNVWALCIDGLWVRKALTPWMLSLIQDQITAHCTFHFLQLGQCDRVRRRLRCRFSEHYHRGGPRERWYADRWDAHSLLFSFRVQWPISAHLCFFVYFHLALDISSDSPNQQGKCKYARNVGFTAGQMETAFHSITFKVNAEESC